MTREQIRPTLLYADAQGSIYDHPHLQMLTRRGEELALPRPDELMPLPPESDLFLLPGRRALGLDPDTGQVEPSDKGHTAVAAFVCPGHTLTGLAAYLRGARRSRAALVRLWGRRLRRRPILRWRPSAWTRIRARCSTTSIRPASAGAPKTGSSVSPATGWWRIWRDAP